MYREKCYKCFWPKNLCWCPTIFPIETRTKIVILMHPKEYKHIKMNTGRFTHLCLKNSQINMGVCFDDDKAIQAIINNPKYLSVLLYPCKGAVNISKDEIPKTFTVDKELVVFLIDATWILAKKMFNTSLSLQKLPRIMFVPEKKSRYIIKTQPYDWCLSTLEATHELMLALEKAGLDKYNNPTQMLDLFARMQAYQLTYINDKTLTNRGRASRKLQS